MADNFTRLAAAFDAWQEASRDAREWIEQTPRFRDHPEHRGPAYYAIAEAQAMAYNQALSPLMNNPEGYTTAGTHGHLYTLGTNCQDFKYYNTYLDGTQTYRLRGGKGELRLMLIQVHKYLFGHPDTEPFGSFDVDDFDIGADGEFEIVLSADKHEGNWIPLDGNVRYHFIQIRRILADIADDPGWLEIVREGDEELDAPQNPDWMAHRFELAAGFVRFLVKNWAIGLTDLYTGNAEVNRLWIVKGKDIDELLGSSSSVYGLGVYKIEPDEALLIEWQPPNSAYWSFQTGDVWSRSLDFEHYQTDLNMKSAVIDDDGKVRVVLAIDDPGVPNWLDPRGRLEGQFIMRDYRDPNPIVEPVVSVIKCSELRDRLPANTPTVTPEQRQVALAQRRGKYRQAFPDTVRPSGAMA